MNPKCVHRTLLEEKLQSGMTPEESKCDSCHGYVKTCPDYTDLAHLMNFYELFKKDKEATQK